MKRISTALTAFAVAAVPAAAQRQAATGLTVDTVGPQNFLTSEAPMLSIVDSAWTVQPLFTVSETVEGYLPPGILDGLGAFKAGGKRVDVLVNHELNEGNGYPYTLANGTMLTGARVSRARITRDLTTGQTFIRNIGLAYRTIYDRAGQEVTDPAQVNEDGVGIDGFARFCSAVGVAAGEYGFVDDIFFTGEESGKPFHPHGGTEWAVDVRNEDIWAIPAMGRAAWENVCPLDTGDPTRVALLGGDDTQSAPLYLYIGQKDAVGDGSFLDRNGLAVGTLYAWKADNGDLDPEAFNGLNNRRTGTWVEVTVQDPAKAGMSGYDDAGYADIDTLQDEADALGCFSFSRPEDLATNPVDGTQAVFASTGRGGLFPSDNWGTVYVIDVNVDALTASMIIVHDADDLPVPDAGIRSPDNLDWSRNGKVYIQEDRSTSPGSLFGGATGIEASIWELDPVTRDINRIATVDRAAVAPAGSTDGAAGDLGNWETSGILDVTKLFETAPGERLFIATVQAHGIQDGPIGGNPLLDEGGQLVFLSRQ